MKTPTRIYVVRNGTATPRLVEAASPSQAIRHVVARLYSARPATQSDLVTHGIKGGIAIEVAGVDAEGELPL